MLWRRSLARIRSDMSDLTAWQEVQRVFEEADKLKALEELYMERGNVTPAQALAWALVKWDSSKQDPLRQVTM